MPVLNVPIGEFMLIAEFKGKSYPDIPLPFDRSELPEDAFFATLPIGQFDARSRNGRTYSRKAVESIVAYVNHEHPCGWWGHPDDTPRTQTAPAIQWLGAVIDEDGIAWGKCVALSQESRDLLRMAKLARSQIGTSIYGEAEMDGDVVTDMKLMYIDLLAVGEWVGVPVTATVPILTAESNQKGEATVEIQELTAKLAATEQERDAAKQALALAEQKASEAETLRTQVAQIDAIRTKIAESADVYTRLEINISGYGSDLVSVISDTIEKLKGLMADQMMTQLDAAVGEKVKIVKLRPVVREMIKDTIKTAADIGPRIEAVLALPHIQDIATVLVAQEAGPSAVGSVTPAVSTNQQVVEEAVAQAGPRAKRMGLLTK